MSTLLFESNGSRGICRQSIWPTGAWYGSRARTPRLFSTTFVTCDLDRVARAAALRRPADATRQDPVRLHRLPGAAGDRRRILSRRAQSLRAGPRQRLGFYKLRAKVTVEDLSESLAVVAGWGDAPRPGTRTSASSPRTLACRRSGGAPSSRRRTRPSSLERTRPPTTPTASRSACRRADAISCSATPSRTRP